MNFNRQIIVIFICYFLSFLFIRGFLYGAIRYQVNNSAYKKRKEGKSFKEWLFYSRDKEELPKILRILYHLILFSHPIGLIICAIVHFINLSFNIGEAIAFFFVSFDVLWILVIALLFWSPGPGFAYERWITKNSGPRKKNRR